MMWLQHLLLDKLKESAPARIINVSSRAHTMGTWPCTSCVCVRLSVTDAKRPLCAANLDFDNLQSKRNYSRYTAYSRSKLAQVLHANKLQRRLEGTLHATHTHTLATWLHCACIMCCIVVCVSYRSM